MLYYCGCLGCGSLGLERFRVSGCKGVWEFMSLGGGDFKVKGGIEDAGFKA